METKKKVIAGVLLLIGGLYLYSRYKKRKAAEAAGAETTGGSSGGGGGGGGFGTGTGTSVPVVPVATIPSTHINVISNANTIPKSRPRPKNPHPIGNSLSGTVIPNMNSGSGTVVAGPSGGTVIGGGGSSPIGNINTTVQPSGGFQGRGTTSTPQPGGIPGQYYRADGFYN